MPNSQRDVLARLRDCVAGKLSIERFYKQVSDDVWTASESSDPGFRELMSSIALLVAEYSANHRTAEDVLSQFSKLLPALGRCGLPGM